MYINICIHAQIVIHCSDQKDYVYSIDDTESYRHNIN